MNTHTKHTHTHTTHTHTQNTHTYTHTHNTHTHTHTPHTTHTHTTHTHTYTQTNLSEQAPMQEQHVTMLHQQLASTSNMCQELLQGQNTMIHAVCQRLDNLTLETTIQSHLGHLRLYQMELEQYYQVLYSNPNYSMQVSGEYEIQECNQ